MIRNRWARSATLGASLATSDVRVASKDRISTSSFGRTAPSGRPLSHAPSPSLAVHSSREPKSWTKPKTTSSIVSPSATAIETAKKGMPRLALSEPSIGSTTTSGRPAPPTRPTSSETTPPAASRRRARMTSSAAASMAVVSSPPSPEPTIGSRSARVGRRSRTASTSATAALQSSSQSVKWQQQQAGRELRIEEGALLRHHFAPSRDFPDVLDGGRTQQKGSLRLTAIHRRDRLVAVRRVRDSARAESVDDFRVEKSIAGEELVPALAGEHRPREALPGRVDHGARGVPGVLRDPVRREDRQPLLTGRNDHRQEPRRCLGVVFLVEREGRLVAVMPVRDQELGIGDLLDQRVGELRIEPPEPRDDPAFVRRQLRLAETGDLDRAGPEEEERLELGARGAKQPQPALLRPRVRALVGQDDAVLVRFEPERRNEALAAPGDAVRPHVLLRKPPARRLGVASEHTVLLPLRKARGRLLLGVGQRQVDDVVRASSAELFALRRADDVVGRRDERLERTADSRVVAERAERPYDCHGTDRTNRAASLPPFRLVRATTGLPSLQARRPS